MSVATITRPTLVLNRNWQPITISTVARALVKVFSGAARVVDPSDFQQYSWEDWSALRPSDGEQFIQAGRIRLRVPEVVTLTHYDRLPRQVVTFSRRNLFKRDRFTCQYCGDQPGSDELTIDHVIPRSQGGVTSWTNCVLACVECNAFKSSRTPDQAGLRLMHKPAQPAWRAFFASPEVRIESWSRFLSEAYWSVELR